MINIKNKIILVSVLMASLFSSCDKDDLNPIPATSISDETAFSTQVRVEGAIRAIYSALKNNGVYGGRYQIFNEIRGGDFNNERTNVVTGYDVWQYTPNNSSTNSVQNHWAQAYFAINLANIAIDGINNRGGAAVVGTALAKNYVAEAKFCRAIAYHSLMQLYAKPYADGIGSQLGVPLRLIPNTGGGDLSLVRASAQQVYNQIIADLNDAETDLPATNGSAILNTTRAHKNTAIAFKTRVYLTMGAAFYNNVVSEANKLVPAVAPFNNTTNTAHALNANYVNIFRTPYTTSESILSMPFASNEAPGTQNQLGFYYGPAGLNGGSGEYSLITTGIIADAGWKATDARRTFIITSAGKSWTSKYNGISPFIDYAPVIRWAEVLLNLAEAKARNTNSIDPQSLAILNAVRQRSDATTTFLATDFATPAAFIDAIMKERRIEFLGEGIQGMDLTRTLSPLPAKPGVAAVASGAAGYIWPISSSELLLNPLCVDN